MGKKEGTEDRNIYIVENTLTKEILEFPVEELIDDTLPLIPNRFCVIVEDHYYSFKHPDPDSKQKLYYP